MTKDLVFIMANPGKIANTVLVVGAIGLVALALATLRDRMNGWLALIVVSVILLVMALLVSPARSHDHNRPELDSWYSGLRSGKGPCCGGPSVDATTLDGAQWKTENGRYRVFLEGEWHDVPPEAVLDVPNLDGRALVWPIKGYGGLTIRCFMPGSMT